MLVYQRVDPENGFVLAVMCKHLFLRVLYDMRGGPPVVVGLKHVFRQDVQPYFGTMALMTRNGL